MFSLRDLESESAKLRHKMDWTAADKRGVIKAFHDVGNCELCALIAVAEAAQAVDDNTLVCPAGYLEALEVALAKFEEAE